MTLHVDVFRVLEENGECIISRRDIDSRVLQRAQETPSTEHGGDAEAGIEGAGHGSEGMHGVRRTSLSQGVHFLPSHGVIGLSRAL